MKTGVVKFYDVEKKFGFIAEHGTTKDYFVYETNLINSIKEGDEVSFLTKYHKKRIEAIDVDILKHKFKFDVETDILSEIKDGEILQEVKITTDNVLTVKEFIPNHVFDLIDKHFVKYIDYYDIYPIGYTIINDVVIPFYAYGISFEVTRYTDSVDNRIARVNGVVRVIINKHTSHIKIYDKEVAESILSKMNKIKCIKKSRKKKRIKIK